MIASNPCPYCLVSPRDSDDHVFPDFLGGTRKVKICTKCNNGFGHRFEGPVSKDLASVIVFLSFSGYKNKRLVVHERAWVDETTGIEYNLDSTLQNIPSKPHLFREDGKVKRIVARSMYEARRIFASLKAKGLVKGAVEKHEIQTGLQPPFKNVRINVGVEMRQLAAKMCVGVGQVVVPDVLLIDEKCREFLLAEGPPSSPVRQTYMRYPKLDDRRPPLAHAVYLEGDSRSARCFGVVQLFGGAFQFYVPLSNSYVGRDFAALGVLDVTTFKEEFEEVERLRLPESPQFVSPSDVERSLSGWGEGLNAQIHAAFGKNAILFGASPKQSVSGLRVTLPLLWIEYELEIKLDMELVPDRAPEKDVTLPTNPNDWVLSPDRGCTTLAIFDTFAKKWNNNVLSRTLGQEHVYIPSEIGPGTRLLMGDTFWCPINSMSISYRVQQHAWLGSVNLPDNKGELDHSEHTLRAQITLTQTDIPMSRDPSWPTVANPESYEAAAGNMLVVKRTDIDIANFRFAAFGAEVDD